MRREMDAAGFAATKLVLPDIAGELPVAILDMIESNADYSAAVDILGVHYCGDPKCAHSERVAALGKEIWMTEGSVDTSVGGGLAWGASLNQNFVAANQTSSVAWSLIWSTLDGLEYSNRGMMGAFEPWSGHFDVSVGVWAQAQTTQFVSIGDIMLGVSTGGSGVLAGGGTFVTYAAIQEAGAPTGLTVVFETMAANASQSVVVSLDAVAADCPPLAMWSTDATTQFRGPSEVKTRHGCVADLTLPPATITTVTSSTSGSKLGGKTLAIPPSDSFLGTSNYSTSFDEREPGAPPLYFSDEGGSFAIAQDSANHSNQVMRQMVPVHPVTGMGPAGPTWTGLNSLPATVIGDVAAVNIVATTRARMPAKAEADGTAATAAYAFEALCGRIASAQHPYDPDRGGDPPGDCLNLTSSGEWKLTQAAPVGGFGNVTQTGTLSSFDPTAWHTLELRLMSVYTAGSIDGVQVFNVSSDGAAGYVGVSSSYNAVEFDDFALATLPGPARPPAVAGTPITFEPCAPGSRPLSSHQGWLLTPDAAAATDDVYTLRPSADKDLCLDWRDATQLRAESCANDGAHQRWNISMDALKGSGAFVRAAGMTSCESGSGGTPVGGCCMEVAGNDMPPGTPADIYGCEANNGAPCANEVFKLEEQDAIARMVAQSTGFCLTT